MYGTALVAIAAVAVAAIFLLCFTFFFINICCSVQLQIAFAHIFTHTHLHKKSAATVAQSDCHRHRAELLFSKKSTTSRLEGWNRRDCESVVCACVYYRIIIRLRSTHNNSQSFIINNNVNCRRCTQFSFVRTMCVYIFLVIVSIWNEPTWFGRTCLIQ